MMNHDFYSDGMDDLDHIPPIRNMPRKKRPRPRRKPASRAKLIPVIQEAQLAEQADHQGSFDFTYKASRHEREWIVDSLEPFYEGQWLDDVLRLLKGGKEAHVYQVLVNDSVIGLNQPYLAAKVYRPRRFRNLKNDHVYRQGRTHLDGDGRQITDDGMLYAIQKRSSYGLELAHTSWIEHEVKTMQILHQAGADVPFPYASGNNAILMTYIGDDDMPAPTLNSIDLDLDEARCLFERVIHNIELMLANDRVHGDLSAYNILYWEGGITLIDFPQAVDPHTNRDAFNIFRRDVVRVCEYFASQGVPSDADRLVSDLWTAYGYRLSPDVHPGLLDDSDEADRAYWRQISGV
jgi:RIO kinase 1